MHISVKGQQKCLNMIVLGTSSGKKRWRSIGRKKGWKVRGKAARETAYYG